ncbi:hypothetical protein D9758_009219 [Tetrapyrgos nigripes]|uniref:Uncharacterized protein n=1 Tax=Tetrapyrgos nigripes TaxID=182062 RepID=A0A8H5FXC1_9AGAR|nr:hypothetical protein D9758_009219 [Tetrapyrgos nigripes]
MDFGTVIPPEKLTEMMHARHNGAMAFRYPENHQFRINGIVSQQLLTNTDQLNDNSEECLIVVKDSNTTDITVGHATGMVSFIRDDGTGEVSRELAVYNYDKKSGVFSAKGDSGSLVVDYKGHMVGMIHAGTLRGGSDRADITYCIPAWWLIDCIKERYQHADFNQLTWIAV